MLRVRNSIEKFIESVFGCDLEALDRSFSATNDPTTWYMVRGATNTMLVPSTNVLRVNQRELDKFAGAVQSFLYFPIDAPMFKWDDLDLDYYYGEDVAYGLNRLLEMFDAFARMGETLLVACDIETRHAGWEDNKLLSIGFAVDDDCGIALADIPQYLYPKLELALNHKAVQYVWHNGKFDCGKLQYLEGIRARIDEDTMLKHFVQVSECKGMQGLKELGPLYLRAPQWDDELQRVKKEHCRKNKLLLGDFTYDLIPPDVRDRYMLHDCIATRRLIPVLDALKEEGTDWIYRQLIRAANVFTQIELAGFAADTTHLELLQHELTTELADAQRDVQKAVSAIWNPASYQRATGAKSVPKDFNMGSPKQLKWLIETAIGQPVASTDADTIEKLAKQVDEGEIAASSVAKDLFAGIMRVRKASKYLDTYVTGITEVMCEDGRVRGTYNLHGTETGRLSGSNPNMQNIPTNKHVKNIFRATQGYKLVQFDFSQAELRVMGYLTKDPFLKEVYQQGRDLHSSMAERIFGENYTKDDRRVCKTVAR